MAGFIAGSGDLKPVYTRLDGHAQGTTYHILYKSGLDFRVSIDSIFQELDRSMSLWTKNSIINRFNKSVDYCEVDIHLQQVVKRSLEISAITKGAFDITVKPILKYFSGKSGSWNQEKVDSLMKYCGYQQVYLLNDNLCKKIPQLEIDVNGLAQGYTVDVIADFLESRNVHDYSIEVGGEVRCKGVNEKDETWNVAIRALISLEGRRTILPHGISISNQSIATSSLLRDDQIHPDRSLHIVDPRTGKLVSRGVLSVSVIANDCITADAFATAFLVLGIDQARQIAKQEHLKIYAVYQDDKGEIKQYQSD